MNTQPPSTAETITLLNALGGPALPALQAPSQLRVALSNQGATRIQCWQVDNLGKWLKAVS
ncbi:MAG: hypothetical protein AB7P76_02820 [Candidatus Melainabacteria bacterium]